MCDALLDRLEVLESALYGRAGPARYPAQSRDRFTNTLSERIFSLENAVLAITSGAIAKLQNDKKLTDVQFPEMCTTCCELEQLLSQKCTPLHSLHTSEKLDVVVSSTESMELTARNLQRVGDLQQYINTPYLQDISGYVQKAKKIENWSAHQCASAELFDRRLDTILGIQETMVETMSRKLVLWDAMLKNWERTAADS